MKPELSLLASDGRHQYYLRKFTEWVGMLVSNEARGFFIQSAGGIPPGSLQTSSARAHRLLTNNQSERVCIPKKGNSTTPADGVPPKGSEERRL